VKYILQLLFLTITPSICHTQINYSEFVFDELIVDTFYTEAKLNIQINDLMNLISIEFDGFTSKTDEIVNLKIETLCKNKDELIIESPPDNALEYSEPLIITINQKANSVKFDFDSERLIYIGNGVNISFSNKRKMDRCLIRD
jgi:hypothetical protein